MLAVIAAAALATPVVALAARPHMGEFGGGTPGTSLNFQVVGHNDLFARGMNAAPTIYGNYLYVGDRTDASGTHTHPGVQIVDITDPANPTVVGVIGPPQEDDVSQTARELRVWPEQGLLIVMNFRCSTFIHACAPGPDVWSIDFYDIRGDNAVHPQLVATYVPSAKPHEMYLWIDPARPGRALLYISTPTSSLDPSHPNIVVADISDARNGNVREIASANWNNLFAANLQRGGLYIHSMALTPDGRTMYLAHLVGGMLAVDTSDFADDLSDPQLRLITDPANRAHYAHTQTHSAVPVPGRPLVVTTDEIYGTLIGRNQGCPWGWVHFIDVSDPAHPRVVGEYRIHENHNTYCETPAGMDDATVSYASHNPTILPNLGFVTWHSGGLQAFDLSNPAAAMQTGWFSPQPLPSVATEDPALSVGPNQVVMWSYPIIRDGLIYVIDIRNGLYVLRYTGPQADVVAGIHYYEGNSNRGDAMRLGG
jgi:hypothetical protein